MSLAHAVLTSLIEKSSSGYDLARRFDKSIGYFWHATHQQIYRELAARSGSAKHWLQLAQLELEQARWQAGLDALRQAERAGAERSKVRAWRNWAESEMSFQREKRVASAG